MPTLTLARGASAVSSAAPVITSANLKQRATAIKDEINALGAARSSLALAALQGDAEALSAVEDIDKARAALSADLETVEAAIPEVQQRERTNPSLPWRELDRFKHMLRATVIERREHLTYNLTAGSLRDHRPNEIHAALANIDPLTIAREIVQPVVKQVAAYDGEDRARLTAERNRAIDKLAKELVEATTLPPLPPEIAKISAA